MPVVLLSSTEHLEVLFKGLVCAFTCTVGLGVIGCTDVLADV